MLILREEETAFIPLLQEMRVQLHELELPDISDKEQKMVSLEVLCRKLFVVVYLFESRMFKSRV